MITLTLSESAARTILQMLRHEMNHKALIPDDNRSHDDVSRAVAVLQAKLLARRL